MNTDFIKMLFGTVLRAALVSTGGYLMHKGIIDQSGVDQFVSVGVSAGMLLAGICWSAWQKYGSIIVQAELAQLAADARAKLARLEAQQPVQK